MKNEAGFSIDVSPGSGSYILKSMWLGLPETCSTVPLSTLISQRNLAAKKSVSEEMRRRGSVPEIIE
jgi:hypothetical protein